MTQQLQLAAFLMPDGYFCEFGGITENGRAYPILQLLKSHSNPYKFRNLFPDGQRSTIERILYYSYGGRYRISNLKDARIWGACEPPLRIYTNDGRSAYFAGEIPIRLKLDRDENGLYKILIERDSKEIPSENSYSQKFVWQNPSPNTDRIPQIIPLGENSDDQTPIYYDGPNLEQARLFQKVGTKDIPGSRLVKYKNLLKSTGVKGVELIPEVHRAGPALCLFLEPFSNESQELGIQGRIGIVYAKYKRDLSPLPKKRSNNSLTKEANLYEFSIGRAWAYAYARTAYSDHPSGIVVKRVVKKEKALLLLDLPLKYSRITGEFKISHKKVSGFFTEILPEILKKNVILRLHPDLEGLRIHRKADFQIKQSSGIDWFDGEVRVKGLNSFESAAVYAAWKAGSKFIRLQKAGWIDLKNLGLESLDKGLDSAGIQLDKNGNANRFNKGQAIALESFSDLREIKTLQKIKKTLSESPGATDQIFAKFSSGPGFRGNLRDYQKKGAQFLLQLYSLKIGGILADEMGLGKTIQCLAFFSRVFESTPKAKILIIVPLAAIAVWEEECRKFLSEIRLQVWHGLARKKYKLPGSGIVLTTYQTLNRDIEIFQKYKYNATILDEAQNVKNTSTDSAKAVRKIKTDSLFCLTGTPMENHLDEFWALFDLAFPGLLGNLRSFQRNFSPEVPKDIEELQRRTGKFLLRRRKSEVLHDLPPKTEIRIPAPMEKRQERLYEKARKEAIEILNQAGPNYIFELLPQLMKLRRLASHPDIGMEKVDPFQSGKIHRFLTMIREELPETSSALVFSQFTDTLSIVRSALDKWKIGYFYLDGKTSQTKRAAYVKRFQNGEKRFFLISLQAGGVSLTLTKADTVFHLDPWWNPAVENQASDRAHRFGQTQPVFVYKLYSENSLEERVLELQEKKRQLFASLLDSGKSKSGKESLISREELRELIE
ncbi:SNF2 family N-terminal domain protein [Leptospira fainei serovar Hurstbridge str. BUT 6]|uniref:SNF2 family N-terminal domain protein n=1 Tax=Leptospira fainei serovar Hurstbridge str. BUT 6 TaxID=1193011 RepID=S3UXJ2_9LEPT|nr:DEAD/DEAH box helicase [Leptospira fainei]EPG75101.1 SNF2 family N-terminal domain protein [Leptospira fainei serovar Hurstbridge str. BUT 6]